MVARLQPIASRGLRTNFPGPLNHNHEQDTTPRHANMPSRIRNSNVRPTASRPSAAGTPNRNGNEQLPPYKKPSHPLDAEASSALRQLQNRHLPDVRRHNKQALEAVTSTAGIVNDMFREQSEYMSRRQKKWDAGKSLDDREDEETAMRELEAKVEEHNIKLEESMRAVIDSGFAEQRITETLDWLRQNAPRQLEDEYTTQMTQRATQRQTQAESQRRREEDNEDGSDVDMDDGPTPGPTPLDGTRVALTGVSELFTDRQQRKKDTYTSSSLTARYARNNEYRDFKRLVHDAKYGDNGPPLGHEDTWFTETGSPAPGITNTQRGDFDDDDDIIMDKATISTRCPVTFQQYKEPYTSTKCPHTFEKNAILDMIRTSTHMASGGKKAVECPVTGCNQVRRPPTSHLPCSLTNTCLRTLQSTTSAPTPSSSARSSACNARRPKRLERAATKTKRTTRRRSRHQGKSRGRRFQQRSRVS